MSSENLLGPEDPAPVELVNPKGRAPLLLVCEHAGQAVPARLGRLGLTQADLDDHIGWDIGAAALARRLALALDAPAVLQRYSRLVIDCNRPPEAPDAMPEVSDARPVPGNHALSEAARRARIDEIFTPFQEAVARQLARSGLRATFSIHSYTPRMRDGQPRAWDAGFLFREDRATSERLARALQALSGDLTIGLNQPYDVGRGLGLVRAASCRAERSAAQSCRDPQRPHPRGFGAGALDHAARPHLPPLSHGDFRMSLTRDVPLVPAQSAVLFIDVQNFSARREGAEFAGLSDAAFAETYGSFLERLEAETIPNMQAVQRACRAAGVEVMYTTIESLTLDGRDRSLDYKITGFNVPKGSWDGKVIDEIAPEGDEIVLPKSSSSVFVSTHIDYILRNLGVRQLVLCGLVTDQCVESAIRDACDLGYLVTQVTDACLTYTQERQDSSLRAIRGYCRQITTAELVAELADAG